MIQDMAPSTCALLFLIFGLVWAGLAALALAVFCGLKRVLTPKVTVDEKRWTRDWDEIERNINE